ncbi:hypothetical protein [uncultured Cohaesibacter sp.]|uniref:hypothetical protein n=1 Tax=uncultured Cohaesibacter sp. TaxID=1002546 RepID=UPI0029C639B1|nr:hypothetical protein [uncultured Cohaesibacter sp.]
MIVTVACPADKRDDAGHLAMILAAGPADAETYSRLNRHNGTEQEVGDLVAQVSFNATADWISGSQMPLTRPDWDAESNLIDMEAAERAQAALFVVIHSVDEDGNDTFVDAEGNPASPLADPDKIVALLGPTSRQAQSMMGLLPRPMAA